MLYHNPEDHPLKKLWDAGVIITLNCDDPTFLNLTLTEELARCAGFVCFSTWDLLKAQYNSVEAAFCNDTKRQLRGILDSFSKNAEE